MSSLTPPKQSNSVSKKIHWVDATDGTRLFAITEGNPTNPAVVLVHGYPDNQRMWDPLVALLVSDYYIVRYDVRGAGQSSAPSDIKSYRLPQLSQDLLSVVNGCIPNRPFHLVGHDWGCIQSWESATDSTFPRQILSFTSISGVCLDHAAVWIRTMGINSVASVFKQLRHSWYIGAFHMPYAPRVWDFLGTRWSSLVSKLEKNPHPHINPTISRDGRNGIALYRANFIPTLINPRNRRPAVPVHVIRCNKDAYVTPTLVNALLPAMGHPHVSDVDCHHWGIAGSHTTEIAVKMQHYWQHSKA